MCVINEWKAWSNIVLIKTEKFLWKFLNKFLLFGLKKPAENSFRPTASLGSKDILIQFDALPENHNWVIIIGFYSKNVLSKNQAEWKCVKLKLR